jgi:4-hydroxy-3-polyprenylbenzoate decarboxylase
MQAEIHVKTGLLNIIIYIGMKKILLGITGASGQIYASKMMEVVRAINGELSGKANGSESGVGSGNGSAAGMGIKLDLVFTDTAKVVWEDELGVPVPANALDNNSYYHPYASGSNAADIMIVMPCTMGTIGRIASGATSDLLTRAADVMLKERRPLIIVPRETPFNLIHLRNLTTLAEAGAIIAPASPSFYTHPQNMEELIDTFVRRILGIAGLEAHLKRFMSN